MPGEDIKTKVCSKCGKELPMTDEYFYKSGGRCQPPCKECKRKIRKEYYETHKDEERERIKKFHEAHKEKQNQYSRDHYARRQRIRNEFFTKWKKPCQKCGEQRLYLIQFHHIDPATKEFGIGTSVTYKKPEICEEEVKKCVCLCSNCHDEFHYFYGANPEDPVNALKEYLKE